MKNELSTKHSDEQTFEVSISRISWVRKPFSKFEIAKINKSFIQSGMTMSQLVQHLDQPYGYTLAPATFTANKRKNTNWTSQSAFLLDFDGTIPITIEAVIQRLQEFSITPNFYYNTFSHIDMAHPKFRVGLLCNKKITNFQSAKDIRLALLDLFPEADKSCKDSSRMFYGGKNVQIISELPVALDNLFSLSDAMLIARQGRTRENDKKRVHHLNSLNQLTHNLTNIEFSHDWYTNYKEELIKNKDNSIDYDKAIASVQIFSEFMNGTRLTYNQLFGIATNLYWSKGGFKLMKDTMKRFNAEGLTEYKEYHFSIFQNISNYEYFPMHLNMFSPYSDDLNNSTIINAVKQTKGKIEVLNQTTIVPKLSLQEAEIKLKESFMEALNTRDKNICIIKATTGLGKTELLTDIPGLKIFYQNHQIKREVSDRMRIKHICVPELPIFESKTLNKKIQRLYQIGANHRVYAIIKDLAVKVPNQFNNAQDIELAKSYIQQLDEAKNFDGTVLSTHARGIYNSTDECLIFDEDPISAIFHIDSIRLSDLMAVSKLIKANEMTNLITQIITAEPGRYFSLNFDLTTSLLVDDVADESKIDSNVIKFLSASHYQIDPKNPGIIHFLKVNTFSEHQKIIILSATANESIYEKLYPGRVKVFDITNVEQVGNIIQYTRKSLSRASMNEADIKSLKEFIGGRPTLTFKKSKGLLNDEHISQHFNNCSGFNDLSGVDIAVVGTNHLNENAYKFIAVYLGVDVNAVDCQIKYQRVLYNGFRFWFSSYQNEVLKQIQLHSIEAELLQAIGRARTLRNESNVMVFSNLPLRIANELRVDWVYRLN
jgi:hypothetical protein